MERFEEKVAEQLIGCCSETALAAATRGVTWAKHRDERLNSIHLLYGLLCREDSIAVTILYQSDYRPFEAKRLLVNLQPGIFEGPFPKETPFWDTSEELQSVIQVAKDKAEIATHSEIDSAHLLFGLLQSESHARDLLAKGKLDKLKNTLHDFLTRRES